MFKINLVLSNQVGIKIESSHYDTTMYPFCRAHIAVETFRHSTNPSPLSY